MNKNKKAIFSHCNTLSPTTRKAKTLKTPDSHAVINGLVYWF